jgi:hypothetical protein
MDRPLKKASLLPKEHGAYAQISFPLITALALGQPRPAALLLLIAITCVFLAHEPLMVLTGGRGGRAKRETGGQARLRLLTLAAIGLLAGAFGLWLSPEARLPALIPVALGAPLVPLILSRKEKTATGELLVAFSLSATMIPVAVAAGVSLRTATIAAAVWAVSFALGTITVRAIIAKAKKGADAGLAPVIAPALCALAIAGAFFLAARSILPIMAAVALVPTALVALTFSVVGIHPRYLKRMGWTLVASNIVVLAALVVALR